MPRLTKYENTETEKRVLKAINSMPYGAFSEVRSQAPQEGSPIELEKLAGYLEALQRILAETVKGHAENERELYELKDQRAAMRAFLGTGG